MSKCVFMFALMGTIFRMILMPGNVLLIVHPNMLIMLTKNVFQLVLMALLHILIMNA